jgi:anti-sigma factor ChrR (cupin superfamily)
MKTSRPAIALVLLAAVAAVPALVADAKKSDTAMADATSMNVGDIKWGDAPPDLPKGAQLAVLHGDPAKSAPYTMRLKIPAGYKIPPHWHTKDEQLTILSGTFVLHMGDTMDAPATNLSAGGFHFLPGKMHHAAEAKAETVVQVDGTGPFDIHYLNPADNPNKHAEATKK